MLDEFKVLKHKSELSEDHQSHVTGHECDDDHSNYSNDDDELSENENLKAFTDDIALTKALCESLINKKDLNVEGKYMKENFDYYYIKKSSWAYDERVLLCRFGQ